MRKMIATSGIIQAMPRTDAWSLLNLLPNFELIAGRKDGNGMTTPYLQRLDNTTVTMPCSEVYDGFNSAYIANASTATVYPGVYFLNVHVKKNTDYVVGVWLKGEKGNVVVLEVCRQSAVDSRPGTGRASDAPFVNYVTIEKDNEWEYHEMTVNSGAYELIEVNYWIGTNGQSAYIAKPSLQESRKGDKGDPGKQGEQGKSATSYRLQLKSGTEATVVANGSGDDVKFTLSAIIYYLVIKNTGGSDTEVTDAKFVATIEGKDRTVLYDTKTNKGYYLEYTGTTAYTATNTPQSAIPLTVTLADGTVLNDSIPVTIQPGVAIDIDNKLGSLSVDVSSNKESIASIKATGDKISAKVASLGRNLLYDAGFADSTPTLEGTMGQRRFQTSAGNTVTVNGDGTLTITAAGNTTAQYTGVYWYVPIQATGYYTASVEVLSGTTVTDGSFAIYTATLDRTQEQNMIGYNAIKTSDVGERVTVTTNNELTEADFGKYLEVYVAVPTNGTIKIKCPQLERGKEATSWTLRGTEDGLVKAGVNIETGKVDLYADRTTIYNSKGKEVAVFDSEGNLLAGSLTCTKDGLTANVKPGEASFLKSGSALGIRIGIIDGSPALYATNENGAVTWKLSIDYGTTTSDTAALTEVTGEGYAAYTTNGSISAPARTGVFVRAYGTIGIKNTSTVMHTYDGNNISIKVDNLWGTGKANDDCDVTLGSSGSVAVNGTGSISFDALATTSSTDIKNFPFSPWQATVHVLYLGNEIGSGKVTMSPDFS